MRGGTGDPEGPAPSGAEVAPCRAGDLALLERHMPAPDAPGRHARCFARHQAGRGSYLVAWRYGLPVASCEVRWDGCPDPVVRTRCPECAEVEGLGAWPEVMRSPGVGVVLLEAAEELAVARRTPCLGIGVERNNPRAEALYKRLGFRSELPYLHCWSYRDGAGATHRVAEARTFMVKRLRRPRGRGGARAVR
ncbi:N-acetyltransferase [Streptomyces sp. JJ36]|uniref:GNAT family N-acetyltransferase n=1 Tax=Streptomyces sp. JJ36 TaxID=2736645 RepID=UPI001F196181|nr:GNAT family N-acetyltransferase [Streptomyces sp. JJ36]MCF6522924.1 GNAT family N-acetyltransferase [Streptomyces sp. JJ36]